MHKHMSPHGDADHMGEAKYLVHNFKVENILINEGNINYLEKELISIADNVEIAKEGTFITCGDIEMIQLNSNLQDENDSSQVYYAKYKDYTFLFMGDASVKSEKYLLNNYTLEEIDILKVGHHGSKTSTSKEFINTTNPKYALISVGEDNKFNHPNPNIINNLKKTKIYRTDKHGSIVFKIKNDKLKIEAST